MLPSFIRLENAARNRRETDKRLVNWWLYIFFLSWLTMGIMSIVVLYQRIKRRDAHFDRKSAFLEAAIDCTREYAQMTNKLDTGIDQQLDMLKLRLNQAQRTFLRPAGATAWTIGLIGVGIMAGLTFEPLSSILVFASIVASFYVSYFLLFDWKKLQRFELDLIDELSRCWMIAELAPFPIKIHPQVTDRSPALYIFLTLITMGIFGFYWDYCAHYDPEKLFDESELWEDSIVNMFRNASLSLNALESEA